MRGFIFYSFSVTDVNETMVELTVDSFPSHLSGIERIFIYFLNHSVCISTQYATW